MKKCGLLIILIICIETIKAQNWNTYPSYDEYVQYMQKTAKNHNDICRLDTIGISVEGRLILCMRIAGISSSKKNKPKFFYSSTMHGNELTGSIMLLRLLDSILIVPQQTINNEDFPILYICPYANPDGTWAGGNNTIKGAVRYNANYVDLNRNYPDIRTGKNSDGEIQQPETKAFIKYQQKEQFNISCNIHTGSEVFNYPWDSYTSQQKEHADKEWFSVIGNDFVKRLNDKNGNYFSDVNDDGVTNGGDWYVIHGSRQDWSNYFAHCREITLELSMEYTPKETELEGYWNKLKNSLFVFFDYCSIGIEGIIKDSISSLPLNNVMVCINKHDKDSSEVFSNSNGYFFRPIVKGNYEITFSKKGYHPKTILCHMDDAKLKMDVQLVPVNTYVPQFKIPKINIYPTITQNSIFIECYPQNNSYNYDVNSATQDLSFVISDISGIMSHKDKIKSDITEINLGSFSAGIYIVSIYTGIGGIISRKIIKR
ncbi:MAG: M14 family zinc carboxypeptidase [Bacteroidales bacterium]